jgi:UrcA family protein
MKTLLPLALLAASFTAAPAFAQPPVAATIVVRTADLDLRSAAGIAALDRRILSAVDTACGDASDADVHGRNVVLRCRADMLTAVANRRAAAIALVRPGASTTLASQ